MVYQRIDLDGDTEGEYNTEPRTEYYLMRYLKRADLIHSIYRPFCTLCRCTATLNLNFHWHFQFFWVGLRFVRFWSLPPL